MSRPLVLASVCALLGLSVNLGSFASRFLLTRRLILVGPLKIVIRMPLLRGGIGLAANRRKRRRR
jgi:hypothetical protein